LLSSREAKLELEITVETIVPKTTDEELDKANFLFFLFYFI
jgi:hypothetical protein